MKIKTCELTGAALDWAVAKCEGYKDISLLTTDGQRRLRTHNYSNNWNKAGPIIEREGTSLTQFNDYPLWTAKSPTSVEVNGKTPLIAAMRAHVYLRLGDEVEIPDELL